MKLIKRTISALLTASLAAGITVPAVSAAEPEGKSMSISNDYLTFSVNGRTGFFDISTLEGHPQKASDNNMPLLYDGDSIETSFTTVRMDGKDYIFGQRYGLFDSEASFGESSVDAVTNSIKTVWTLNGVKITQTAYLSRTNNVITTGNVSLAYEVENETGTAHDIGIRVMLDNSLGAIDAPVTYVQKETSPINKETEFFSNGREPGDYVRFTNGDSSAAKDAFILFNTNLDDEPDELLVGHWYNLASTKWDYSPDSDMAFSAGFNEYGTADTASSVRWNEQRVESGSSFSRAMLYGVGDFTASGQEGNFNITLELDDDGLIFENGSTTYKDNIVKGHVTIYNNVDGSADINNAQLTLSSEDGAFFVYQKTGDKTEGFQTITENLGFIPEGGVVTYDCDIAVAVPEELKAIKVVAGLVGNTSEDTARAEQFIIAPAPQQSMLPKFAATELAQTTYYKEGKRVFIVSGIYDIDLLEDRTKWKAAFVSKTDPSLRYEVRSEDIAVTSENSMTILYDGDMVVDQYYIEYSFFEDFEQLFGRIYNGPEFFISDDEKYRMSSYSLVGVIRKNQGVDSVYRIIAADDMKDLQNMATREGATELVLVLKGDFQMDVDDEGNILGYTALGDYTLNDVVVGEKGSSVEYDTEGEAKGVRVSGKDRAYSAGKGIEIMSCDWCVRCPNGFMRSLTDKSLRLEVDNDHFTSAMFEIAFGMFNAHYGVLGKRKDDYTISYGGTLSVLGYGRTKNDASTKEDYTTRTHAGINLTAQLDDVMFDKDGFYGINATFKAAFVATNILGCAQQDAYGLAVTVNTIDDKYGFQGTLKFKSYLIGFGGGFALVAIKDDHKVPVPDMLKLSVAVPPVNAVPIIPGIIGIYAFSFDLSGMSKLVDLSGSNSAEEARKAANAATTNINLTGGVALFEVIGVMATASLGTNHFYLTGKVSAAKNLLFSGTASFKLSWQFATHDDNGKVATPRVFSASLGGDLSFLEIIKGGISGSYTWKDIESDDFLKRNYFAANFYGGLYLPKGILFIGGMELLGAEGTIDNSGVLVGVNIVGIDVGVSYSFSTNEFSYVALSENNEGSVGVSNMRYLTVTSPQAALSDAGSISGSIVNSDDASTMVAVNYFGKTPDISQLSLSVDGASHTLEAADAQYKGGNCIILPDEGEGGRILIGLPDIEAGNHELVLNAASDTRLASIEAAEFLKPAKAKSVAVNPDGTVTVNADESLNGSTVELYYVKDKDMYENIETEQYTDEEGKIRVRAYKTVGGERVEINEDFYSRFKQHLIGSQKVTENTESVTITPEYGSDVNTGDYYVMALIRSPYGRLSRCIADNSMHYDNIHQPAAIKGVRLENAGDEGVRVRIEDAENADNTGYFVSLYCETDGTQVMEPKYYPKGEDIEIFNLTEAGKKYRAEAVSVNVYSAEDFATGGDMLSSESIEVRQPRKVEVSSQLMSETVDGIFRNTDKTEETLPYIKGNTARIKAEAAEDVKGRFIIDGISDEQTQERKKEFEIELSDLAPGRHTVGFAAENSDGDTSYADEIVFAVAADAPSVMLEKGAVMSDNGRITLSGQANAAEKIIYNGQEFPVAADGSFEIEGSAPTERFAQRQSLTAVGFDGRETEISFIAVNSDLKPYESIILKANGSDADNITLRPGESAQLSAFGVSGGEERDMGDAADITVYDGNSLAVIGSDDVLTAHAPGKAYVKAVYSMGEVQNADGTTTEYKLEDMLEVNIAAQLAKPVPSIPDGASTTTRKPLTISGDGDIYYTLDGSEPTSESTKYTGPITLPEGTVTVKAKAIREGSTDSETAEWTYTVKKASSSGGGGGGGGGGSSSSASATAAPSTDAASTAAPSSSEPGTITASADGSEAVDRGYPLTLSTDNGVIYYTTDGSTPNKNSAKYEGPITINEDTKVRAVVWTEGDNYSDVFEYDMKLNAYGIRLKEDAEKGSLITGFEDGTFRPEDSLTRAQNAAILRRATTMYGYHINDHRFPDVDMWAKDYINELAAADVVTGYEDGTFRPDNTVTRAEFVAMLMRVIGEEGGSAAYSDTSGHWAEKYIAKANEYGYIGGYEDGTFRPDSEITRAEAVVIMSRVFSFDANGTSSPFSDLTPEHWAFGYIAG